MISKVRAFIGENRLLHSGDRIVVALSGGADSVTLLHLLCAIREDEHLDIHAAHLNHGIRGDEADRDEQFVRELCGRMRVPLHVRHEDIPAIASQRGESLELCGREARYAFFEELRAELGAKIATAHTMSDSAETVIWNLVRGSGLAGLSGIPVRNGGIIRPLLCCSREEIEAYCEAHSLRYVTDSTNLEPLYTRNFIRLRIMPLLHQLNENAEGNIARTAGLMREADECLKDISLEELKESQTDYGYDCERLLRLPVAVLSGAIRELARQNGASMDHAHTDLVTRAMHSGGAVELGGGWSAVCAQGTLRLVRGDEANPPRDAVRLSEYPDAILLHLSGGEAHGNDPSMNRQKIHNLLLHHCIPCDIITDEVVVRSRREGDAFTDPRRKLTKTLKKLFNELKIPRERRDSVRLVARGSEVLWIDGVGVSSAAQIDRDYEGDVLWLKPQPSESEG